MAIGVAFSDLGGRKTQERLFRGQALYKRTTWVRSRTRLSTQEGGSRSASRNILGSYVGEKKWFQEIDFMVQAGIRRDREEWGQETEIGKDKLMMRDKRSLDTDQITVECVRRWPFAHEVSTRLRYWGAWVGKLGEVARRVRDKDSKETLCRHIFWNLRIAKVWSAVTAE